MFLFLVVCFRITHSPCTRSRATSTHLRPQALIIVKLTFINGNGAGSKETRFRRLRSMVLYEHRYVSEVYVVLDNPIRVPIPPSCSL